MAAKSGLLAPTWHSQVLNMWPSSLTFDIKIFLSSGGPRPLVTWLVQAHPCTPFWLTHSQLTQHSHHKREFTNLWSQEESTVQSMNIKGQVFGGCLRMMPNHNLCVPAQVPSEITPLCAPLWTFLEFILEVTFTAAVETTSVLIKRDHRNTLEINIKWSYSFSH